MNRQRSEHVDVDESILDQRVTDRVDPCGSYQRYDFLRDACFFCDRKIDRSFVSHRLLCVHPRGAITDVDGQRNIQLYTERVLHVFTDFGFALGDRALGALEHELVVNLQ